MTTYRAIVSIEFDDTDLDELADAIGVAGPLDPDAAISGALDNLELGCPWIEQLFKDGKPTIARLSNGIKVEVNPHD